MFSDTKDISHYILKVHSESYVLDLLCDQWNTEKCEGLENPKTGGFETRIDA